MSHFYGICQGNRGEVTRCGSKNSGFDTVAASWEGSVRTRLWYDEEKKEDYCRVYLSPWHGSGIYKVLYEGPVSGRKL
jgi:hypothetical protein